MRRSASYAIPDFYLLKKKLVFWAEKFSSAIFFDRNNYASFDDSRQCILAAGELQPLIISKGSTFEAIQEYFDREPDWLFGYLSYDISRETEPSAFKITHPKSDGIQFPHAHFFRPRHLVEIENGRLFISSTDNPDKIMEDINAIVLPKDRLDSTLQIQQRFLKQEYCKAVLNLKEHILNGDLYEINLCQEFFAEHIKADPSSLFIRLNEINPAPFACYLKHQHKYLICASPERFLKKSGINVLSQPIKGTIQRDKQSETHDRELAHQLRNDPKEQSENIMIVDLMRNDLARSCEPGSITVDELFGIYSFPNVHQMISTVSGVLRKDCKVTDALKNAFPMGSMTGAPKVKAMELIEKYEKTNRGLFSGSVGFITPEGDFDFNVVIRSLLYNSEAEYLSFQTGSAITHLSIPEIEYEECLLKAAPLIETLVGKKQ
jgi:para-aminobenzoate synthetase component 1